MKCPVSDDEVKLAIFDIAADKAPGPDGHTSGFYQAAWPIMGAEVMQVVRDFFTTGRLLRQVNATVLALIPKVHNPTRVLTLDRLLVVMFCIKSLLKSLCKE